MEVNPTSNNVSACRLVDVLTQSSPTNGVDLSSQLITVQKSQVFRDVATTSEMPGFLFIVCASYLFTVLI